MINKIKEFFNRCQETKPRIAVIGDCMIDEYYRVDANRVSPEHPIPVLFSDTCEPTISVPGGAANVCCQFKHFPFDVNYYGFLDKKASEVCTKEGIKKRGWHLEGGHYVPRKKRFYQDQFPLCRWDVEQENYGIKNISKLTLWQKTVSELFRQDMEKHGHPSVIIFSDYGKGLFENEAFNISSYTQDSDEIITIVDPKKGPIDKWKGCGVFKPNAKEACSLSGLKDWKEQCKFFQSQLGCQAIVITQGGDGVVGSVMGRLFEYRPTRKIYPDSVIGAGDCFIAFLAMALSHSMDIKDAVEIAYEAGAVYVQRKYNEPVSQHELLARVDPEAAKLRMPPTDRNYKLVFTNGCFDIMHEGHLSILRRAKEHGDKLIVAVNSDESIKRLKGNSRPIIPLKERMKLLAGLQCVDFVVSFDEDTPYELIKEINPDILVKGQDWEGKIVGSDIVKETIALPLIDGLSTSSIIEKIRNNSN